MKKCSKCHAVSTYHEECLKYKPEAEVIKEKGEMDALTKKMQERSRRKIARLMEKEEIEWKDGKFIVIETGEELGGLYFQKKYWEELGIEGGEDDGDDFDF